MLKQRSVSGFYDFNKQCDSKSDTSKSEESFLYVDELICSPVIEEMLKKFVYGARFDSITDEDVAQLLLAIEKRKGEPVTDKELIRVMTSVKENQGNAKSKIRQKIPVPPWKRSNGGKASGFKLRMNSGILDDSQGRPFLLHFTASRSLKSEYDSKSQTDVGSTSEDGFGLIRNNKYDSFVDEKFPLIPVNSSSETVEYISIPKRTKPFPYRLQLRNIEEKWAKEDAEKARNSTNGLTNDLQRKR